MNSEQLTKLQLLRQKPEADQWPGQSGLAPYFADAILTGKLEPLVGQCRSESYGLAINAPMEYRRTFNQLTEALGKESLQKVPFPMGKGKTADLGIQYTETFNDGVCDIAVPRLTLRQIGKVIKTIK